MPRFVPRQRKHKVLARESKLGAEGAIASPQRTNQTQILPTSKAEKEKKRQALRDELRAQQPKISGKKQKRLDKYIDNKLKKDENLDLLKKLAIEKDKFDTSNLQSSKNLKKRSFTQYADDALKGYVHRQALAEQPVENNRAQQNPQRNEDRTEEDDDAASVDSFEEDHKEAFGDSVGLVSDDAWLVNKAPAATGTGLAQPLQLGLDGVPLIPVRASKRGKKSAATFNESETSHDRIEIELPWEGFDSEPDTDQEYVRDHSPDADTDSDTELSSEEGDESLDGSSDEDSGEYSEDDEESDTSTSASAEEGTRIKPRTSAFKTWATQQLNQSIGHVPSYEQGSDTNKPASDTKPGVKPAAGFRLKLPEIKADKPNRSAYSVHVNRASNIQENRQNLPILQREQEIMEAIYNNPVVVIKGDTGSGKTTQLPQFLYEAGFGDPNGPTPGIIGITQPRRVAAVSMARRVAEELGDHGNKVAHQIRFDSTVSRESAIKFMTDGILLRELSQDLLLKKYSVIVIDEAHERSINTDILIGMLSKIVPARMRKSDVNPDPKPLKLIIMSATLNLDDFLNDQLFPPQSKPPIVVAEGRQYRVTTHFALRSRADYVEETVEKVKRAHKKLPHGGILVFLTGQNEIKQVMAQLQTDLVRSVSSRGIEGNPRIHISANEVPMETEDFDISGSAIRTTTEEDDIDIHTASDDEAADREFEISDEEDDGDEMNPAIKQDSKDPYNSVHVLPLYSQLPTKEQLRVFEAPPAGSRLIVLATNVAETSLTIPGIKFVFDCGRSKERKYNLETGVQSFEIDYISKASAQQRAGRAGRTGPGHCWRLYSSAVFESFFPEHAEPGILRSPAESVVMQLKGLKYPRPVSQFPFPTAPSIHDLTKAEKLLRNLGALSSDGLITDLGHQLSTYPLSPRLGKILAKATAETSVLGQIIAVVAGLSVSEIFVSQAHLDMTTKKLEDGEQYSRHDQQADEERDRIRQAYGRANATFSKQDKVSDVAKLLTAVLMYIEADDKEQFCQEHFLRPKAMSEVQQLVNQLHSIIRANHPGLLPASMSKSKLSSSQVKHVNNNAAAGYIDQVAIRWDLAPTPPALPVKPRRAIDVPYFPLIPLKPTTGSTDLVEKAVFIHPSSVLSRSSTKDLPPYIVYTHLQQSQAHTIGSETVTKTRMFPLTPIDAATLVLLVRETALIEYGKPVAKTKIEEVSGTPKRRICWVTTEVRGGQAGTFAWPLPPSRVRQVMDLKVATGWRVEEVLA